MHQARIITTAKSPMIDAATQETAVTLVGVASFTNRRDASDPFTMNEKHLEQTSNAPYAGDRPLPAIITSLSWKKHDLSSITDVSSSNAHIIMSSIGFGIDPSMTTWGDATEAAVRALRDATERNGICLTTSPHLKENICIQLKIGVPPVQPGQDIPMKVDTLRLSSLLPRSVTLLPIQVVVGGLLITSEASSPSNRQTICTAVASLRLQQHSPVIPQHSPVSTATASPQSNSSTAQANSSQPQHVAAPINRIPWANPEPQYQSQLLPTLPLSMQSPINQQQHQYRPVQQQNQQQKQVQQHLQQQTPTIATRSASQPSLVQDQRQQGKQVLQLDHHQYHTEKSATTISDPRNAFRRGNSIEMLAMISEELRERTMSIGNDEGGSVASHGFGDSETNRSASSGYNYKKLPPGVTPKNNKRLFVKHNYRDHSLETPQPEETYLVESLSTTPARTPNAAFPLKLHETLSQIEKDGYGNIIGWLPHGRSFKIHEQKEFVHVVLPKYFVMTKKSSFLRQLNLYGFNRLSGVGSDQGSYYHEKFLKGMKYLCRRMTRQKVNGNGIRAAGNPDEEPVLSRYPVCPATRIMSMLITPPTLAKDITVTGSSLISKLTMPAKASLLHIVSTSYPELREENVTKVNKKGRKNSGVFNGIGSDMDASFVTNSVTSTGSTDSSSSTSSISGGGGAMYQVSFPLKLQRILDKLDADGKIDVISWLPHGRAFLVHNSDRFVAELMPLYFNQTKFSSFQRQLHMYNFQRITTGRDKGAYHHVKFQRGNPKLCLKMVRTRVNGKGCRRPGNPNKEPNLYDMDVIPPMIRGTKIEIPVEMPAVGIDGAWEGIELEL